MKWILILIGTICLISAKSQNNQKVLSWYELKYGVATLEELGSEKLQIEKEWYAKRKNLGIGLTAVGFASTMLGFNMVTDSDNNGFEAADFFKVIGICGSIVGLSTWAVNGSRHHQLKKALSQMDIKLETLNSDSNARRYQVGFIINF